jgi:hypothetical protein
MKQWIPAFSGMTGSWEKLHTRVKKVLKTLLRNYLLSSQPACAPAT